MRGGVGGGGDGGGLVCAWCVVGIARATEITVLTRTVITVKCYLRVSEPWWAGHLCVTMVARAQRSSGFGFRQQAPRGFQFAWPLVFIAILLFCDLVVILDYAGHVSVAVVAVTVAVVVAVDGTVSVSGVISPVLERLFMDDRAALVFLFCRRYRRQV